MEDFVTIQIARKLKEKGFKEECLAFYTNDDKNSSSGKFVDVPTISQALKWLREEKKIFVEIALSPEGYRHIIYTGVYCTNTSSASYFSFDDFYNHENNYMTYEQAALAGIEYVLDNLI